MALGSHFSDAQRAGCTRYLRQLFGDLDAREVDAILATVGTQTLATAEVLFAQGDAPEAFYIVLSGRLRAIARSATGEETVLGDIAAGEPVGELALFTREGRMASVVATRPSLLLRITEADYLDLVRRFPPLAVTLNQFFIRRLRQNGAPIRAPAAPRNVAIINLCERTDLGHWTMQALSQFALMGTSAHVIRQPANPAELDAALNFETVEDQGGLNLLLCDPVSDVWTRGCLAYADLILLAVDFRSEPSLREVERELGLHGPSPLGQRVYLLLLHPADAPTPRETHRWLEPRRVSLHLHLREDHAADLRRFCRIVTNQAVGLVLSGGGAKGYAHLGAVQALQEAGLEFDFVGGSSAGALFGGAMSLHDFKWPRLLALFSRLAHTAPTSRDYTWPLLSLLSGRKMRRALKHALRDSHLEDLWTTFYCVSSNYSTAALALHERGLARRKVEASIAIPGVFPPVLLDGQLHLDGGLFDNLPILAMLKRPVGRVVAVSLSTHAPRLHDLEELPSSWQLFWDQLTRRRRFSLPSLPTLLANSLLLNSKHQLAATAGEADLLIRVDLQGFGLLDWARWQQTHRTGYEQTRARLASLPPEEKFWHKPRFAENLSTGP